MQHKGPERALTWSSKHRREQAKRMTDPDKKTWTHGQVLDEGMRGQGRNAFGFHRCDSPSLSPASRSSLRKKRCLQESKSLHVLKFPFH